MLLLFFFIIGTCLGLPGTTLRALLYDSLVVSKMLLHTLNSSHI